MLEGLDEFFDKPRTDKLNKIEEWYDISSQIGEVIIVYTTFRNREKAHIY